MYEEYKQMDVKPGDILIARPEYFKGHTDVFGNLGGKEFEVVDSKATKIVHDGVPVVYWNLRSKDTGVMVGAWWIIPATFELKEAR